MFLESCGKLFFSHARPLFFYCFLLLPFVLSGSYLVKYNALQQQSEIKLANAVKKGKTALEKKKRKERFMQRYSNPDLFFLDKNIESFSFLNKECSNIKSMLHHPTLSDAQLFEDRLQFLLGSANRLAFIEQAIRSSPRMKETEEKQKHPIQMDEDDLKKILSLVEDISVEHNEPAHHMPQLLVLDIKLRKVESLLSEVCEVEMALLKREWSDQ